MPNRGDAWLGLLKTACSRLLSLFNTSSAFLSVKHQRMSFRSTSELGNKEYSQYSSWRRWQSCRLAARTNGPCWWSPGTFTEPVFALNLPQVAVWARLVAVTPTLLLTTRPTGQGRPTPTMHHHVWNPSTISFHASLSVRRMPSAYLGRSIESQKGKGEMEWERWWAGKSAAHLPNKVSSSAESRRICA